MLRLLTLAGRVSGAATIAYGIFIYSSSRNLAALLISLAVLIAGPVEDLLKGWVRRRTQSVPEEPLIRLVDLATSVVFLVLLLWALFLIQRG